MSLNYHIVMEIFIALWRSEVRCHGSACYNLAFEGTLFILVILGVLHHSLTNEGTVLQASSSDKQREQCRAGLVQGAEEGWGQNLVLFRQYTA